MLWMYLLCIEIAECVCCLMGSELHHWMCVSIVIACVVHIVLKFQMCTLWQQRCIFLLLLLLDATDTRWKECMYIYFDCIICMYCAQCIANLRFNWVRAIYRTRSHFSALLICTMTWYDMIWYAKWIGDLSVRYVLIFFAKPSR